MKLHRNAALSWQWSRRLATRVVREGWTLTAAAAAAASACAARASGSAATAGRASAALHDRSSAPRRVANRTPRDRVEAIVAAAPAAVDGGRDRRDARDGALDRLGDPHPGWAGPARPDRARAAASATSARARASSCTSTSSSWAGSRAAPASVPSAASAARSTTRRRPTATASAATASATSACTCASTTTAASPTPRCSPTRRQPTAVGFLRARGRLLPPARDHGRARADRQRQRLPLGRARTRLPPARHPPPPHPPLPPADQRQGRALHPHPPRGLGLRRDLRARAANAQRP